MEGRLGLDRKRCIDPHIPVCPSASLIPANRSPDGVTPCKVHLPRHRSLLSQQICFMAGLDPNRPLRSVSAGRVFVAHSDRGGRKRSRSNASTPTGSPAWPVARPIKSSTIGPSASATMRMAVSDIARHPALAHPQDAVHDRDQTRPERVRAHGSATASRRACRLRRRHGNRIGLSVGEQLIEAVGDAMITLPRWDRDVLRWWKAAPCSF